MPLETRVNHVFSFLQVAGNGHGWKPVDADKVVQSAWLAAII